MAGDTLPPVIQTVEATDDQYQDVMDRVIAKMEELARTEANPKIGADPDVFNEFVDAAIAKLEALSEMEARPTARLNNEDFLEEIAFDMEWLRELGDMVARPDVELPVAKVITQMQLIAAAIKDAESMAQRIPQSFEETEGSLGLLAQRVESLFAPAEGSLTEIVMELDQMTSAAKQAGSQVTDLRGAWAALFAQANSSNAENALRQLAIQGGAPDSQVAQLLASSRTSSGAADVAALYGLSTASADKGGGGGGLLKALGFGAGAFGLASFGSIGSLAGFGLESMLTTGAGVLGSLAGAGVGAGALGLGALGVGAVGMGTDMAGIGQAINDQKAYSAAVQQTQNAQAALAATIQTYGANSVQAGIAQRQFNDAQVHQLNVLNQIPAAAQAAIVSLQQSTATFRTMFDQATGPAEAKGAAILQSLEQVGEKFLPTIGKFASENMTIIMAALGPLETWMKGPGLGIFTQLEQTFQSQLPTAMDAFDNGVELLMRTLGFLAPYTGGLLTWLDDLLKKLNGPDFGKFTGDISHAIGIFRDWMGLVKAVSEAVYLLFHNDAGTGTSLVTTLTDMVNHFNHWASTVAGGDQLHALLESHKNELIAIITMIGQMASAWGQLELAARPIIMDLVTGLTDIVNFLSQIPGVGAVMGLALAFGILGSRIGFVKDGLMWIGTQAMNLLRPALLALGGWLTELGGPFAAVGGWLTGWATEGVSETEALTAAINGLNATLTETVALAGTASAELDTMGAGGVAGGLVKGATATAGAAVPAGMVATESGLIVPEAAAGAAAPEAAGGLAALGAAALPAAGIAAVAGLVGFGIISGLSDNGKNARTPRNQTTDLATLAQQTTGDPYATATSIGLSEPKPLFGPGMQPAGPKDYGASNIEQISKATGLADGAVKALAQDLKVNLNQALTPDQIAAFTGYVKDNGGAATITGELWQQASQKIQAGMIAAAAEAHKAMPQIPQATADAVEKAQPHLVDIVAKMKKSGDDSGAGWVAAYLSHLPASELASKDMHDKALSPLLPLVADLKQIGDNSAAALIQSFIDGKNKGHDAAQQMHDALKNPLYNLQTELGSEGHLAGADLIQNFLSHHKDAQTAGGAMHDAITGQLNPLVADLNQIGATAAANLVQAFINQEVAAYLAGQAFANSLTSPILNALGAVNRASGGIANIVSQDSALIKSLPGSGVPATGPGKAGGGAVTAGNLYTVGEYGPELFAPGVSGNIISGGGGGGVTIGSIVVGAGVDPEAVGKEVANQVRKAQLKKARFQGPSGGVYGQFAGSR